MELKIQDDQVSTTLLKYHNISQDLLSVYLFQETLILSEMLASNKLKPPFITQVVKMGDEIIPKKNKTSPANSIDLHLNVEDSDMNSIGVGVTDYFKSPWDPVVDLGNNGNSLDGADKDTAENGARGFLSLENENRSPNVSRSFRESGSKASHNNSKNTSDNSETEDYKFASVGIPLTTSDKDNEEFSTRLPEISITMNYTELEEYWSTSEKPTINDKSTPFEFVTNKPLTVTSTVRALIETNVTSLEDEIQEPVLKPKSGRSRSISRVNKRLLDEKRWTPTENLNPPAMGATESWRYWEPTASKSPRNVDVHNMSSRPELQKPIEKPKSLSFTVQFLPQRLLHFLEQAEKYAKLAFSPFMADDKSSESRPQRRLKYLPHLLFGKETSSQKSMNESKKQETGMAERSSDGSKLVLPYSSNVESSFQPQFIPLTEGKQKDADLTNTIVRISRPEAHIDTPVINS